MQTEFRIPDLRLSWKPDADFHGSSLIYLRENPRKSASLSKGWIQDGLAMLQFLI